MFRKKLLELYGEKASQIIINDDHLSFLGGWYYPWCFAHLRKDTLIESLDLLVPLVALNNAPNILNMLFDNLAVHVSDKAMAIYLDSINEPDVTFDPNSLTQMKLTQMELMITDHNTPTEVLHLINHHIMKIEAHTLLLASPCTKILIKNYIDNMDEQCKHADTKNLQVRSGLPILNAMIKIKNMQKILSLIEHIFPNKNYEPVLCLNIIRCAMSILKFELHDDLSIVIKSQKVNLENGAYTQIAMLLSSLKTSLESIFKRIMGKISEHATPDNCVIEFFGSIFNTEDAKRINAFRTILNEAEKLPETDIFARLIGLHTILINAAEKYEQSNEIALTKAIQDILSRLAFISNGMFLKLSSDQIQISEDIRVLKQLDEIFSAHEKENKKTMGFSG